MSAYNERSNQNIYEEKLNEFFEKKEKDIDRILG